MATKSIHKEISFNNSSLTEKLLSALEKSKFKNDNEVEFSKSVNEIKGKSIKTLFGM